MSRCQERTETIGRQRARNTLTNLGVRRRVNCFAVVAEPLVHGVAPFAVGRAPASLRACHAIGRFTGQSFRVLSLATLLRQRPWQQSKLPLLIVVALSCRCCCCCCCRLESTNWICVASVRSSEYTTIALPLPLFTKQVHELLPPPRCRAPCARVNFATKDGPKS